MIKASHQIRAFLKAENMSVADFAKAIGVRSAATIYSWLKNEKLPPEPENVINVYKITHGKIEPNHFYDLPSLSINEPAVIVTPDTEGVSCGK